MKLSVPEFMNFIIVLGGFNVFFLVFSILIITLFFPLTDNLHLQSTLKHTHTHTQHIFPRASGFCPGPHYYIKSQHSFSTFFCWLLVTAICFFVALEQQECNEVSWAEAQMLLAFLWGSRSRSVSSRERGGGDQVCVRPSNNQHSREAGSPLLLLFIFYYCLSPLKATVLRQWHSALDEMDVLLFFCWTDKRRWSQCG